MRNKLLQCIYFTCFINILFTSACNNPQCNNTNPIFNKYPSESEQYTNELAEQLGKDNNLKYYLNSYEEIDYIPYLNITVHSDSICAKAAVRVINSDSKLDGIIKNKGNGYGGAELKGLHIGIAPDTREIQFVYRGIDKIVD